jgi:hypothetical protein
VTTTIDAFVTVGLFLIEAGEVEEGILTLLHHDGSLRLPEVRAIVERHAVEIGGAVETMLSGEERGSFSLEQAVRHCELGLAANFAPARAHAAGMLEEAVSHFLRTRKPAAVFKRFAPRINQAIADPPKGAIVHYLSGNARNVTAVVVTLDDTVCVTRKSVLPSSLTAIA